MTTRVRAVLGSAPYPVQISDEAHEWLSDEPVSSGGADIERRITLHGDLSAEQRTRLLEIANACPVHKTLSNPIRITSALL